MNKISIVEGMVSRGGEINNQKSIDFLKQQVMVWTKTNSTYLVAIKVPGHVVTARSVEIQQDDGSSIRSHYLKERRTELALASTY
jgi:hypothetical protein